MITPNATPRTNETQRKNDGVADFYIFFSTMEKTVQTKHNRTEI